MRLTDRLPGYLLAAVLAGGLAVVLYRNFGPTPDAVRADVRVPELSELASTGEAAFDANCARCHGAAASGTDKGPPLVHDIYNPGHHADMAFLFAASRGVRRHHWPYGDMPPQPQVTKDQIAAIVQFVRELQVANGITYRPHKM